MRDLTFANRLQKHFGGQDQLDRSQHCHHTVEPGSGLRVYRGAFLMGDSAPLGTYGRNMPRALWWSYGRRLFLISEVPL